MNRYDQFFDKTIEYLSYLKSLDDEEIDAAVNLIKTSDLGQTFIDTNEKSIDLNKDTRNLINNILKFKLCMNPSMNGYKFLIDAIELFLENGKMVITKELYPILSEKYGVSSASIESAIGYAIKKSWDFITDEDKNEIFGYIRRKRPTIVEYIYYVCEYLKEYNSINNKKKSLVNPDSKSLNSER